MKKTLKLFTVFLLILSLSACSGREIIPLPVVGDYAVVPADASDGNRLRVGLVSGLYGDMFSQIIQPLLKDAGYEVEVKYYDNYEIPNIALAKGELDLNMSQHYASLNNYKFKNNKALSAIAEVPTAPMGVFSTVYRSLNEIEDGATVSIPAESADLARALIVLQNAGLIILDPAIDEHEATLNDIIQNDHALVFSTSRADKLVLSLMFCELSVIDYSIARKDNLKLADALYQEVLSADYLVVIAVQTERLHEQFVSDIINIIYSDPYKNAISGDTVIMESCQPPPSFSAEEVGFIPRSNE